MDDEEWLVSMSSAKPEWEYHEICLWLPYKPETVEDIANDMAANGFRQDRAIATYEGKILDGRHRYEAALKAGVDPIFAEFQGTKEEAIAYVTSENVARRHLNNKEKEFFYVQMTEYLGVRKNGDRSKAPTNVGGSRPKSAKEHADSIVGTATANLSVVNDHDRAAAMWADKNYFLKEDKTFSTQPLVDSIVVKAS